MSESRRSQILVREVLRGQQVSIQQQENLPTLQQLEKKEPMERVEVMLLLNTKSVTQIHHQMSVTRLPLLLLFFQTMMETEHQTPQTQTMTTTVTQIPQIRTSSHQQQQMIQHMVLRLTQS